MGSTAVDPDDLVSVSHQPNRLLEAKTMRQPDATWCSTASAQQEQNDLRWPGRRSNGGKGGAQARASPTVRTSLGH